MKTLKKIFGIWVLGLILSTVPFGALAQNETKPYVAVVGIDSKGLEYDSESLEYMVRLELEKSNVYNVIDKYDMSEILKASNIDVKDCLGKTCVVAAGKALKTDKMITGYVERFGEKIVISLKVIDVKTEAVEKQDATEYLNLQEELQKMIAISVQKVLGLTPDKELVNLLVNYDVPINSPRTKAQFSGPRMGATMMFGDAAKVYTAKESEGGFNMYPVMFNFGWQQEIQYLSAGNFAALVEILPMIGGLESGKVVPSLTLMNGFRMGKGGWEVAFGPSFRFVQKAWGYYDSTGAWTVTNKWDRQYLADGTELPLEKRLDSRGRINLSTSLMLSVGRTFKSGYLNIPVNIYGSFRKEGTIVGVSCGFNITRQHMKKNNHKERNPFEK